jgi:hypothetical protein
VRARTAAAAAFAVSVGAALVPVVLPGRGLGSSEHHANVTDDQRWDSIPRSVA